MQPGDVKSTISDTTALQDLIDFKPKTKYKEGINEFVTWFKNYYGY